MNYFSVISLSPAPIACPLSKINLPQMLLISVELTYITVTSVHDQYAGLMLHYFVAACQKV